MRIINRKIIAASTVRGILGTSSLLLLYFTVVTVVSGWSFALTQFSTFWYFIISLTIGFGIQVGLYFYLRDAIKAQNNSKGVVVTSGATTSVAMLSCCSHYLVNILPIIGISGAITLIAQYQVELFWLGLAANLLGITYMIIKIIKFSKS